MKKVLAIVFVAFAALFVIPHQVVVGAAAVLVVIALWKGYFDSDPEPNRPDSLMNIGCPEAPLQVGRSEQDSLGASFMPASMTKFRADNDLSIR